MVPPHRTASRRLRIRIRIRIRIRVAGRSYADFAITVFGVAGAEGKAMGSACAFASHWLQSVVAAWLDRPGTGPSLSVRCAVKRSVRPAALAKRK